MKEIRQIIQAYVQARSEGKRAVLATVVHIEGSAYRAPGARMLITEDGQLTGAISGGCLEGDVLRKALLVITDEKPLLITYDTSDEENALIGVSLGCNGIIRILLEPIRERQSNNVIELLQLAMDKEHQAVLITFFSPSDKKQLLQGTQAALINNNILTAAGGLPVAAADILPDLNRVLADKASAFVQYPSFTAFIEYIAPVPSLVIAGAGNDVIPLVQMAALLDWDVTLLDGRPAYANQRRFPGCQVMITQPDKALQQIQVNEHTAIVLMSHNYQYDKAVLAQALASTAAYIGILGPKKKKDRLREELAAEGVVLPAQDCVYGPIGLDIGAETSEEIALAIIAEIKAVFAGRPGASLRSINGNIHQRKTQIVAPMQTYAVLLLAAGASKRLGAAKQDLLYQGDTLLRHAVRTAKEIAAAATVVVTGVDYNKEQLHDLQPDIVVNTQAQEGMGSSVREGVRYICDKYPQVQHILIMLCDQPYVNAAHLRALIDMQQTKGTAVAASYYAGRKGVPALFQASLFPQLLALQGDTGAKHLIENLGDEVVTVAFPEGAIDIDTKEAYQQILEGENRK